MAMSCRRSLCLDRHGRTAWALSLVAREDEPQGSAPARHAADKPDLVISRIM
jgi:hypothetical protein